MKVTQAKRLDYLVQFHSAVITGLVASDRASMGLHLLESNIEKNRIAPLLNALLDALIEFIKIQSLFTPLLIKIST